MSKFLLNQLVEFSKILPNFKFHFHSKIFPWDLAKLAQLPRTGPLFPRRPLPSLPDPFGLNAFGTLA
jgi:hypothetical protein